MVGIEGIGFTIMEVEGAEASEVPLALVAVTVKVYAVLFVKFVIVAGLELICNGVPSPDGITVYEVAIEDPVK